MKVRNDYNSFQNSNYNQSQSHTHHITECQFEAKQSKLAGELTGAKKEAVSVKDQNSRQDLNSLFNHKIQTDESKSRGIGRLKNLWDSLADEEGQNKEKKNLSSNEKALSGISGAATAFQEMFPERIINKWQAVREKLKVNVSAALKKFGKGREAFSALADSGTRSKGKRNGNSGKSDKWGQVSVKRDQDQLSMKILTNSHLMDSYSKSGEYCQLNENLTYQKKV